MLPNIWSENVALLERLNETHSNPPIVHTMALNDLIGAVFMSKATVTLHRLTIPSEKRTRTFIGQDFLIRFSAGLQTYLDVDRRR